MSEIHPLADFHDSLLGARKKKMAEEGFAVRGLRVWDGTYGERIRAVWYEYIGREAALSPPSDDEISEQR